MLEEVGDQKSILTSDMENLEFALVAFVLALVQHLFTIPPFLPFRMVMYVPRATACWKYVVCFLILILWWHTVKRWPQVSQEILDFKTILRLN